MTRSFVPCILLVALAVPGAHARPDVDFIQPPVGYAVGRIALGAGNSATALAPDPEDGNFLYVAGFFGGASGIVRLDIRDGQRTTVYSCPTTVSVDGFAVLSSRVIFVSDSWHDRLHLLLDDNPQDGDFDDAGEIRELIAPILTHPTWGWTGMSVLIVRSATNRLGLPEGTVLFQSEDGETTQGEVLAVVDPLTSPAYHPPGGAFFSGFNYGGGLAMDSQGRLIVASSFFPDPGKVWICEDVSGDGAIGEGESNIIVPQAGAGFFVGLSALTVDAEDRCLAAVGMGASSDLISFVVPHDPLHTTASVTLFATLNSPYVSGAIFNTTRKTFAPHADDGATMIIAAYDQYWGTPASLLTLRPFRSLGVRRWNLY